MVGADAVGGAGPGLSGRKFPWRSLLVGLVVVVGLPVLAHWARRRPEAVCALDGVRINPDYRVEVVDNHGRAHQFCCVRCARIWLDRQAEPPRAITVTDEATGEALDAAEAWYVHSLVVTTPTSGNRIHVFRNQADAAKHAAERGGTVLSGTEKPFP